MSEAGLDARPAMLVRALDWRTPEAAFLPFADDPHVAWFDSRGEAAGRGRFSMLAVDPFHVIASEDGRTVVDGRLVNGGAFDVLADYLGRYAVPGGDHDVPFTGGAAGFLGYELGCAQERVARARSGALGVPDMAVGLYDLVFGFDRETEKCWLFSSGLPLPPGHGRTQRAMRRAGWALGMLDGAEPRGRENIRLDWRRETGEATHCAHVARAQAYIAAGDIYQANITARFLADRPESLRAADLHLALRARNPAPFGAFLACGERLSICSASPERFVRVSAKGDIEARPIKGTRPRGRTLDEDTALREDLLASEKDRAENLMIVDLLRNDIGRVAEIGSVTVPEFCAIETFAHVHHLVSSVRGKLRPGLSAVDVLRACFPGGSITGAPKIRAMQIIAELEDAERGPYCGAVLWIGWDGAMDSSIAIRTVTVTPDTIAVQAGGGIVAYSDPADEFEEMMVKVRPLLTTFGDVPA